MKLRKIVSGGQTGADQGALAACVQKKFPYGGWVPKGRRSEKGKVPAKYRLRQHWSRHYPPRTEKNVVDSDGTVIFTFGQPDGGSLLTIDFAKKHKRPWLAVDLNMPPEAAAAKVVRWVKRRLPDNAVLNVAGSRRSKAPGIHLAVKRVIVDVIEREGGGGRNADRGLPRKTKFTKGEAGIEAASSAGRRESPGDALDKDQGGGGSRMAAVRWRKTARGSLSR